jgi:hypothetical protein
MNKTNIEDEKLIKTLEKKLSLSKIRETEKDSRIKELGGKVKELKKAKK